MDKTSIQSNLHLFDEEARELLGECATKPQVVIVGGSAFVLMGQTDRATHDIDVLSLPNGLGELIKQYGMNLDVAAYSDCLPYNYEDRLIALDIGDCYLEYLVPSLEDLVVMKLYGYETLI